jgi:hypothetical protein
MPLFVPAISIVKEDNASVVASAQILDFTEPDGTLVTESPTGEANIAMTQYAKLAGRSGGQTLIGGTASGNDLTLQSTSHATRGDIFFWCQYSG